MYLSEICGKKVPGFCSAQARCYAARIRNGKSEPQYEDDPAADYPGISTVHLAKLNLPATSCREYPIVKENVYFLFAH